MWFVGFTRNVCEKWGRRKVGEEKNKKLKNWNYVNSNQKRKRDNNTGKPFLPGEPGGP